MQFLKGDIQEGILKAAEEVFLEKGYKDASTILDPVTTLIFRV